MSKMLSLFHFLVWIISITEALPARYSLSLSSPQAPRINSRDGLHLVEKDLFKNAARQLPAKLQRSNPIVAATSAKSDGVVVTNSNTVYTVVVGLGQPAQNWSANTWVGALAQKAYVVTSSSVDLGQTINVTYGSGSFHGEAYNDTLTLLPNLILTGQTIGSAINSTAFASFNVSGILGLGPSGLGLGKYSPNTTFAPLTPMENVVAQNPGAEPVFGLGLVPLNGPAAANGMITFGGVESDRFDGDLLAIPKSSSALAAKYWSADVTMSAGETLICTSAPAILDSGTTMVVVATEYFHAYSSIVNTTANGYIDRANGLIAVASENVTQVPPLNFVLNGKNFPLISDASFLPENVSSAFGAPPGVRYAVLLNSGRATGSGLEVTIGMKWLERYCESLSTSDTSYNLTSGQVSVAGTPFTNFLYDSPSDADATSTSSGEEGEDDSAKTSSVIPFVPGVTFPVKSSEATTLIRWRMLIWIICLWAAV